MLDHIWPLVVHIPGKDVFDDCLADPIQEAGDTGEVFLLFTSSHPLATH